MRDPYDVLGVPRTASEDEIKKAFRRLAKRHHPDNNRDDARASDRFSEVNSAYEVIGDDVKRKQFDRGEIGADGKPRFQQAEGFASRGGASPFEAFEFGFGNNGPYQRRSSRPGTTGAEGAEFSDVFSSLFGGESRSRAGTRNDAQGADVEATVGVTLEDIASVRPVRVILPGARTLEVALPVGVENGQKIRLRGQGKASPLTGQPGDAIITVRVLEHPLFRKEGTDLFLDVPLALDEAVLGAPVRVPTLTGAVEITVPKGANDGQKMRLRGKGLPGKSGAGDLIVTLRVRLPQNSDVLDEAARKIRAAGSYPARGPEFDQ